MRTAVVTGATRGIGRAMAIRMARGGTRVVAIGRDGGALESLRWAIDREELCRTVTADLRRADELDRVERLLREESVSDLVNCAGIGAFGAIGEMPGDRVSDMVSVNVAAATRLIRIVLPGMKDRGEGRICNVASLAAFFPGPYMSVYYATKAYLLSLGRSLAAELSGTGVTVTTLCPGPVDTGFQRSAGFGTAAYYRRTRLVDPDRVAAYALRAMERGKVVAVPGVGARIASRVARVAPERLLGRAMRSVLGKRREESGTQ